MLIKKYNITLKRLESEDIEMVRQWRNSSFLKPYMHYREYITPEMQRKWFESMDVLNDQYFIIQADTDEKAGLVFLRNIDFRQAMAETGIFVSAPEYLETYYPVIAQLIVIDYGMMALGLEKVYGHTYKMNKRALEFHKAFGAKKWRDLDENSIVVGTTRDEFFRATDKLRTALSRLTGSDPDLKIIFQGNDPEKLKSFISDRCRMMENQVSNPEEQSTETGNVIVVET